MPGIPQQELHTFFQDFCAAFPSFNGELIARRYATPYLALGSDGSLKHCATPADVARHFQTYLDRYREQGCHACAYEDLSTTALGSQSALASLTWRLTSESGELISSWRESYNLLRGPQGLLIYASTDHL